MDFGGDFQLGFASSLTCQDLNMATTPKKCHGAQDKTWHCFLPVMDEDSHYVVCRKQQCSSELRCECRIGWPHDEARIQSYRCFLAEQREKKREIATNQIIIFILFKFLCPHANSPRPGPSGLQKDVSPSLVVLSSLNVVIASTSLVTTTTQLFLLVIISDEISV